MRVSDTLASNWNSVWAASILFLKCFQLQLSIMSLSILSAVFAFIIISVALLIDTVVVLFCDSSSVSLKTCKGGICWHSLVDSCTVSAYMAVPVALAPKKYRMVGAN
ncbi:hypothetical protein WN943_024107 [Citrus x changshan-huyou]